MSSYDAHPTAIIDEGASIGAGTRIWHFSHVGAGARIGEGCSLGQNVFVAPGVRIGDRVRIQNNVSIYAGVLLEDEVFCGPSMVFTNVRVPRAASPVPASAYEATRVCRGASIGANATVVCGVTIGRWALVGAGAVVTRDVPEHGMVIGVPGRLTGFACVCGERIRFGAPPPPLGGEAPSRPALPAERVGVEAAPAARAAALCARCGRHYRRDGRDRVRECLP